MANLIRKPGEERSGTLPTAWEPFRWDPLRVMRELVGWDPFAEMLPATRAEIATFVPRFEVKETKDAYVFKADVPGIEEKDLELTLTGSRLTVGGMRESEARTEGD